MYKLLIRPILFCFDPEKVHHFTFSFIKFISKIPLVPSIIRGMYQVNNKSLERELFGLKFKNPIGLAAGFDKNAVLYNELANFGFGFVEIGTVTPKGQEGNPKKRLFRLKSDKGIINRMGFNNEGLEAAIDKLKKNKGKIIIGGNIGKNTATKPEDYTKDYLVCFEALHPYVDYFVLNVSRPNVGSHAKLTDKDYLEELIAAVQKINNDKQTQRPILLKIAPDLNKIQLDEIIELVANTKIDKCNRCIILLLVQGIILVAVAFAHEQENEENIGVGMLKRALEKLGTSPSMYHSIDVDRIRQKAIEMQQAKKLTRFEI